MPTLRVLGRLQLWVSRHRGDVVGVSTILVLAVLFLSPALKDGGTFGGFDLDTTFTPLGSGLYSIVHNHTNSDAVSQMISWNTLDWRLVRSGHFPLWNDYSGLGMPQFLNFESSVLSLPDLVSYAFPLRLAFLVVVFVKLLIAGTGTYAWCRAIRLGTIAATFGGVSFMLAGAFSSWVTWPLTDVVAWTGWICTFAILSWRSGRLRHVVGLGGSIAFSIYGGFPEANIMVVLLLVALGVGVGLASLPLGKRPSIAAFSRVAAGSVFGVLLAAPLWFPGLQVIAGSHRETEADYVGLPVRALPLLFSSSYLGLPFQGAAGFELQRWNYYETVSYVGVIAIVLAVVAVASAARRPVVVGLCVALVVSLIASYESRSFRLFETIVDSIRPLSMVRFERMRVLTSLVVAVLGAIGLDRLIEAHRSKAVRRGFLAGLGAVGVVVGLIALNNAVSTLPAGLESRHLRGLIWPALLLGALGVAAALLFGRRTKTTLGTRTVGGVAIGLLVLQTAFLFFSGVGIASYSHAFYPATGAENQLTSIVGSGLLGIDAGNVGDDRSFKDVGLFPEMNIGYGVRLFAIHDPVIPTAYYRSWPVPVESTNMGVALFIPDVDTAALARNYGINFVIAKSGLPPPSGTVHVATLAGEGVYRVPGASRFSFASGTRGARVVSVVGSATTAFSLHTTSTSLSRLVLRVTAVPGWRATVDGRPVGLVTYDGVMESVEVPAGAHEVRLWYLPGRLVSASIAAVSSIGVLVALAVVLAIRRRAHRARPSTASSHDGEGGRPVVAD